MYIVFLSRSVNEHFLCLQLTGSSHIFFTSFNQLTLRMVSVQVPLCLEDMCLINIFFRLDEYPIEILALLPRAIRQRLYRGLSPADRLHYKSTTLYDDVDRGYNCDEDDLVEIIFSKSLFKSQFLELHVLSCLKIDSDTCQRCSAYMEHIAKCYSSLPFTLVKTSYGPVLVPKRFLQYISVDTFSLKSSNSLEQLLSYCNFKTAPEIITISINNFIHTVQWEEFEKIFMEGENLCESIKEVEVDPVLPLMQTIMSTVKTIVIVDWDHYERLADESRLTLASYVLLYNIFTSQQSCLSHIRICGECGMCGVSGISLILAGIVKLFSHCNNHINFCLNNNFQLVLATPPLLFLKVLSVGPKYVKYVDASSICESTRAIIASLLHSLERVSIHGLGFTYDYFGERNKTAPEYHALLCTLTDLLKQPQFQSMSIGRSPLCDVYQLIEAFLCTEATHHQYLEIAGVIYEEEHRRDKDDTNDTATGSDDEVVPSKKFCPSIPWPLHPLPAQPLAANNRRLKSLDICCSSPLLHSWLASIPNLQLCELKTFTPEYFPNNLCFVSRSERYYGAL